MANRILDLEQKKDALLEANDVIIALAKTDNRVYTADERTTMAKNLDEVDGIVATIALEKRQAAAAGNAYSDVRVRDNSLDKPFGPEARSGESEKERKMRLRIGFGEQLQAVRVAAMNPLAIDPRLLELNRRGVGGAAGASEAVPADGGFLIMPDFQQEIMAIGHDTGLVFTRGQKVPLSEETTGIKIPSIDEQARTDGSRWGGVRMYWMNEADALTGSKPKFRLVELAMKKLGGLYYATDELIKDAAALGTIVTRAFGEEWGFKMDDAAINGDGAGKPLGVANAANNSLIVVNKESGQAASTVLGANVIKMWHRLYARCRKTAVWFVNQDVEQQLIQMYLATANQSIVGDTQTVAPRIYIPNWVGETDYGMMFGRPVIPIEQASSLTTQGDIILADMSSWLWADKDDMQQASSMHVRFLTDEMTYRWIYRVDGQPWWHTALTPFNGTNTLSPFVTLQAR